MRLPEYDSVQVAIIVVSFAVALLLISVSYIAYQNMGSQSIVLATAAVIGTMFVYGFNLFFELRGTKTADHVTVEITIDRLQQKIGQGDYGTNYIRMGPEQFARDRLVTNHPDEFKGDGEKLTRDFILFSLLNFLVFLEQDWQMYKVSFKGRGPGSGLQTWQGLSNQDECTLISEQDLRSLLSEAGNIFAHGPLQGFRKLCLPPKSHLKITTDSLVMRSPICQLTLHVDEAAMIHHAEPKRAGEGPLEMSGPELPNGGPRFDTRLQGLRIESKFFALRAHHRDKEKHQEWLSRVIRDAHAWFEG